MSSLGGTYSTGTVALTNDNAVVLGTGVLWSDVEEGDWLYARGAVGIIESVNDDLDEITLQVPWAGETGADLDYVIVKMSWLRYEPAITQAKLRALLSQIRERGNFVFVTTAPPDPELGEDGQFALKVDGTPWRAWLKVNGVWIEQALPIGVTRRVTVRVATTANIDIATALNDEDTLDGVTLADGDLVLVKDQSDPAQNAVIVVGATPERAAGFTEFDNYPGLLVAVQEGADNAGTFWLCAVDSGGTLDMTPLPFTSMALTTVQQVLDELGIHAITVSTEDPSGGQDGDLWFKVPA